MTDIFTYAYSKYPCTFRKNTLEMHAKISEIVVIYNSQLAQMKKYIHYMSLP